METPTPDTHERPEPDYQKGFNEGYTLAKHAPELAEQLAKAVDAESVRGAGLQAGRQQFIAEQTKERYPSWLKGERSGKEPPETGKHQDRSPDVERD